MESFETSSYTIFNCEGEPEGEEFMVSAWPEEDFYIDVVKEGRYGKESRYAVTRPSDMDVSEFAGQIYENIVEDDPDVHIHLLSDSDDGGGRVIERNLSAFNEYTKMEENSIPSEDVECLMLEDEGVTWERNVLGSPAITRHIDSVDDRISEFLVAERNDYTVKDIRPVIGRIRDEVEDHSFEWRML